MNYSEMDNQALQTATGDYVARLSKLTNLQFDSRCAFRFGQP